MAIILKDITELPAGTATLANPIMFGIGELLHTTTLEDIKTLLLTGVITEIPPNKIKIVNVFPHGTFDDEWAIDELLAVGNAINDSLATYYGGEITTVAGERIVFRLIQSDYFEPEPGILIPNVLWRYYSEVSGALSFTGITSPSDDLVPNGLVRNEPENLIELGSIGVSSIESGFNAGGGAPYTMDSNTFITAFQDGVPKIWKWIGGDGLFGGVATPAVSSDFLLLSQAPVTPLNFLPVKKIETTPYTITADDINRPLWFTSNDQVVNVPTSFLTANTNILLYDFKAYFSGTGTHTVNHPQSGVDTFSQGDLIYALRYDNAGDTAWVVKKWFDEEDIDESKWEITGNDFNLKLPTETEWNDERLSWGSNNSAGAFGSPLKLTRAGFRVRNTGLLSSVGTLGFYWSSTPGRRLDFDASTAFMDLSILSQAGSLRLIVDGTFTQQEFEDNYENETFEFQGLSYGFVYNPTTDKIWLDRNLGASQVATSSTDSDAYGDLYQWGRSPEGHQVRTSELYDGDANPKPTFAKESGGWDGKFITNAIPPNNWLDPTDNDLWQGVDGLNESFDLLKLIGKNGLKASYNDLLDKPLRPDPTDNNRPEWDNGTEWKGLAYVDDTQGHTIKNDAGFFKIVNDADEVLFNVFGETDAVTMELRSPAGFYTSLSNIATAPRAISLPDEGGTLETKPIIALTAPSQVIGLDRTAGRIFTDEEYNATYTHTGAVAGGNATLLIDTTGEAAFPSVTGATLVTGSDFEAGETFEMHVYTLDGTNVRYFFLKIS